MKKLCGFMMGLVFFAWGCDGAQDFGPPTSQEQSLIEEGSEQVAEEPLSEAALEEVQSDLAIITEFRSNFNQVMRENFSDCHAAVAAARELMVRDGQVFSHAMLNNLDRIRAMNSVQRQQVLPHLQGRKHHDVYVEGAVMSKEAFEQWDRECLASLRDAFLAMKSQAVASR